MTRDDRAGWENGLWRVAAESYGSRLHAFLLKRLDRQDVEDVMQEIYVRLSRVPRSEFVRNPEAYIFTVARHAVTDFCSEAKRLQDNICIDTETMQHVSEHPEHSQPDEIARSLLSRQLLDSFLNQLPPEQAVALLLFERDGCSYTEIAKELGVSERAVERYLSKARERLAELLRSQQDGAP
jgi:RNA polymerase sigma factor (sigma-70 family)